MFIESISTYNYRNLEDQTISLHKGVNFLIGKNGQGKTNLIEAVSLLSRGRSFRTNKSRELIKSDSKESSVFANVANKDGKFNLGVALKTKEREYFYNQDKLPSLKDFLGKLISISFSPDDLSLVKDSPIQRRNFLDKHILDVKPSYIDAVFNYQRAVKNKSSILKNSHNVGKNELIPWNTIMSEAGYLMMKERQNFLEKLIPRITHYYRVFSKEDSDISINLKNSYFDYANFYPEKMLSILNDNFEKEIYQKSCLAGVHKDEVDIMLNGKNSRFYASQGETRSLVLALKISVLDEIESAREVRPILLLDDVDSELDSGRRQALADIIFSKERQIIITGTQLPHFEQQKAQNFFIFRVSNGTISREEIAQ